MDQIKKRELELLRFFNIIISLSLIILVSSFLLLHLAITKKDEVSFSLPQKALFLDIVPPKQNIPHYSISEFLSLSEKEQNELINKTKGYFILNESSNKVKNILKELFRSNSDLLLEDFAKKHVAAKYSFAFFNDFKSNFANKIKNNRFEIIKFEKIYGSFIGFTNSKLKKTTAAKYMATINLTSFLTYKKNTLINPERNFYYNIFITLNADQKITKFEFKVNNNMYNILQNLKFLNYLNKDTFKSKFSEIALGRDEVQKLRFKDVKTFKVIKGEYISGFVKANILINDEKYIFTIKNFKIIKVVKK